MAWEPFRQATDVVFLLDSLHQLKGRHLWNSFSNILKMEWDGRFSFNP